MAAKQYYTSKYGTKIDITGLDAATIKRVKELADTKYGTKAAEIAKAAQAKLKTQAGGQSNTGNQAGGNQQTTSGGNQQTTSGGNQQTTSGGNQQTTTSSTIEGAPTSSTIDPNAPGLSNEDKTALTRLEALLGQGELFGRNLAKEFYAEGSLGRVDENLTPEEKQALLRAQEFTSTVGNRTQDVQNLLNQQQGILTSAQQLSPEEQEALNIARGSLSGLSAPELEGLRSQARQNIQGTAQAQARELAKQQARNQVFGGAAIAQRRLAGQDAIRETRNLERDLLVKNIDIKQAAQNAFTNLVTNTESNKASRTNAASSVLANTMLGDESQRNAAKQGAINSEASISSTLADKIRQLREFNLNQAAAEKAGQIGSIFGGIGTITGQSGLLRGEDFAGQQFNLSQDVQKQIMDIIKNSLKKQEATL